MADDRSLPPAGSCEVAGTQTPLLVGIAVEADGGGTDAAAVATETAAAEKRKGDPRHQDEPEAKRLSGDAPSQVADSTDAAIAAPAVRVPVEERACRFCLESEEIAENPLIAPCLCRGSMRFVHRACLDEWRCTSFNPKALVSCTTCKAHFRTRYEGSDPDYMDKPESAGWWLRFAKDVAWYVSVRLFAFIGTSIAFGFWPRLALGVGGAALHPNPLVNHLLVGGGSSFAVLGTFFIAQLPGLWQTGEGCRLLLDLFCGRRGGGGSSSKGSGIEYLIIILVLIGVFVCLYYLISGIFKIFNEGRQEVVRAVRQANKQMRGKVVKDFVVLDYAEHERRADAAAQEALRPAASATTEGH